MFLPILDVDIRDAANEQLEFTLVEDINEVCGDEFVEAGGEGLELVFDALLDAPGRDETAGIQWFRLTGLVRGGQLTRCIPSCFRW